MLTAGALGQAALVHPGDSLVAINASMVLLIAIVEIVMGLLFLGVPNHFFNTVK